MKKILFCLFSLLALAGCNLTGKGDSSIEYNGSNPIIVAYDQTTIEPGIRFTTTDQWTAYATDISNPNGNALNWLTLGETAGKAGNNEISISLEQNLTNTTRRALIKIICGKSSVEITLIQNSEEVQVNPDQGGSYITYAGKIKGSEIFGQLTPKTISYTISPFGVQSENKSESQRSVAYADKKFEIQLSTPTSEVTSPASGALTSVDESAEFAWVNLCEKQNGTPTTSISLTNVSSDKASDQTYAIKKDDHIILFIYSTQHTNIKGSTLIDMSGTVGNLSYVTFTFEGYGCELKEGWNEVLFIAKTDASADGVVEMGNIPKYPIDPSIYKWVASKADNVGKPWKVREIAYNGNPTEPVHYGVDARVTAVGYTLFYGPDREYELEEQNNKLIAINHPIASYRWEYGIDGQGMLSSIKTFNRGEEDRWAKFTRTGNLITYAIGLQRGVTQNIETTITYQDKDYKHSNFDIAYDLYVREYSAQGMIDCYDGRAGIIAKRLPQSITFKGDNTDKYDQTITYRYVYNSEGYVTEVYEKPQAKNEFLLIQFKY